MKLGVLGGTFDPVHSGHVALARLAIECAGLDRLLAVPAQVPPHRDAASAGAEDRLEMCRLAFAAIPEVEVSDLEVRRPGPSYTIDTLTELARLEPAADLHLVLGWDAARLLPTWRDPAGVVRLARLVLIPRPGIEGPSGNDLDVAGIDQDRALVCAAGTPAVDATEVRRRAATGEPLGDLVPASVAEYIRKRGLYGR